MRINWGIIIITIIGLMCLYLLLGTFGLLPNVLYEQCNNITLKQAQTRGCCEDRPSSHPVSWIFGSDNCDRYKDTNDAISGKEEVEK